MSLTPQLIKDQEFEIKFRGFDPIEVKDYLENIANEFFELQELYKEQLEELEELKEEKEDLDDQSSSLQSDIDTARKAEDELKEECERKEEKIEELSNEIEELQLRIGDMEQEEAERQEEFLTAQAEQEEELLAAMANIEEANGAFKKAEAENERLNSKLQLLQEQIGELKKEEVDFKSTLATAQRFADELKEESLAEAEKMIEDASEEIEKIREDAREELERLPREINELKMVKMTVKAELKAALEKHLEHIDSSYPDEEQEAQEGDELFQKITINEDGSLAPEELADSGEEPGQSADEEVIDSLLRGGG